jgi:hypothetical protein
MPITDPTDVAGCTIWLEADAIAGADGSNPTVWPDQSGGGRDFLHPPDDQIVNGTSPTQDGNRPPILRTAFLNGHNVLEFERVGDPDIAAMPDQSATMLTWMGNQSDVIDPDGYTIFAVVNRRNIWHSIYAASRFGGIFMDAETSPLMGCADQYIEDLDAVVLHVQQARAGDTTVDLIGTQISTGDWWIAHVRHASPSLRVASHDPAGCAVQGDVGTNETGNWDQSFSGFCIGGHGVNATCWDGYMAGIIVYNRALTLTEEDDVLAYLATRYDLTVVPAASLCVPAAPEVAGAPFMGVV